MKNFFSSFFVFLLFFAFGAQGVFASGATMNLSPQSGSYAKPFTVNLVIDGHGDKFNAAQATVTIPPNLAVKDLTLGDCNFSFLKTPSIENPSFAGVIISTYSTKCTVYTLTLIPRAKGQAMIGLSKGSVKRFGDAVEILTTLSHDSYTLTSALNAGSAYDTQIKKKSQQGLYALNLKIYSSSSPVSNATITLNAVSEKNKQEGTTDTAGTVHFSNVQAGVYDAVVSKGFTKVGETIVNVSGPNHILTLGINLDTQKNNPLMKLGSMFTTLMANPLFLVGILIMGILVGIGVALLVVKIMNKKSK